MRLARASVYREMGAEYTGRGVRAARTGSARVSGLALPSGGRRASTAPADAAARKPPAAVVEWLTTRGG